VSSSAHYKLVRLASGVHSVHSVAERETFHPVIGPVAEAEALYVRQLRLPERLAAHKGEFVIWDVGLGAAANVLTVLRATREAATHERIATVQDANSSPSPREERTGTTHREAVSKYGETDSWRAWEAIGLGRGASPSSASASAASCPLRILSFDHTLEPLQFAFEHATELGYFTDYEEPVKNFLRDHHATFTDGPRQITWQLHLGDFPTFLTHPQTHSPTHPPSPHAILFDAFSPAKNPAMWTAPLFADLFRHLDPARPCALPTYSRSTMLRVSLLIAGFYVGAGHATGEKEETTIAANTPALISEPLDQKWLQRARNSSSAEPLWEPVYRQARLTNETLEKLRHHPQFK
jgi:tRNA U34 5-methylaminomethyl-2-thiouridine-forming methyltransferase MnmC